MAPRGYTRIHIVHQDHELQRDALRNVGVDAEHIYSDVVSSIREAREPSRSFVRVCGDVGFVESAAALEAAPSPAGG